jgi:outer membrane biosynthesis protein TonB
VLQVVILRDGLLVGTEVFVPGSYTLGSSPDADLRLDDATVDPSHAVLYFQNGKAAVQDSGSAGGLYVNGHQVTACEIRAVDEVVVGPFVLKARVLGQKPTARSVPPPEVSALLGGAPPGAIPRVAPVQSPVPRRSAPTPPPPPVEALLGPDAAKARPPSTTPAPGTMPSARRRKTNTKSRLKAVSESELATTAPYPSGPVGAVDSGATELDSFDEPLQRAPSWPPAAKVRAAPAVARSPQPRPTPPPYRPAPAPEPRRPTTAPHGPVRAGPPRTFSVPAKGGRGAARIYFEVFWGEARQVAKSFGPTKKDKPVTGGLLDSAMVPLYGFTLPEGFPLAESSGGGYRLFVPPRAEVDRRRSDGTFVPMPPAEVEKANGRRSVSLQLGSAVVLREGDMACLAFVAPPPERAFVNPFRNRPWFFIFLLLAFATPSAWWILFGPKLDDLADFSAKNLNPVAVRLMAPQKKEEKKKEPEKKKEEPKKEEAKKEEKKKEEPKKIVKPTPKPVPPPPKVEPPKDVTKALAKVTAAGPAMKSMLAAINKIGPGGNNTAFKLSGLVGKGPLASTNGLPGIGLGKGSGGGREILLGAGGGGIGALGVGNTGKGPVRAGVTRAVATSIGSQGQIDKEAVARVINSHLAEVQRCYEAALLHTPGLAGKVVLEWTISTAGKVVGSKSKSSTMKDVSVEACILRALNNWQFPPAKGNSVIITYPFIFNAVGF